MNFTRYLITSNIIIICWYSFLYWWLFRSLWYLLRSLWYLFSRLSILPDKRFWFLNLYFLIIIFLCSWLWLSRSKSIFDWSRFLLDYLLFFMFFICFYYLLISISTISIDISWRWGLNIDISLLILFIYRFLLNLFILILGLFYLFGSISVSICSWCRFLYIFIFLLCFLLWSCYLLTICSISVWTSLDRLRLRSRYVWLIFWCLFLWGLYFLWLFLGLFNLLRRSIFCSIVIRFSLNNRFWLYIWFFLIFLIRLRRRFSNLWFWRDLSIGIGSLSIDSRSRWSRSCLFLDFFFLSINSWVGSWLILSLYRSWIPILVNFLLWFYGILGHSWRSMSNYNFVRWSILFFFSISFLMAKEMPIFVIFSLKFFTFSITSISP